MDEPRGDADEGAQVFRLDLLLLQHSSRAATLLPSEGEKEGKRVICVCWEGSSSCFCFCFAFRGTNGTFACRGFFSCQLQRLILIAPIRRKYMQSVHALSLFFYFLSSSIGFR